MRDGAETRLHAAALRRVHFKRDAREGAGKSLSPPGGRVGEMAEDAARERAGSWKLSKLLK